MTKPRIFTMSVARVYPLYLAKVQKKARTQEELDEVIRWLTGYDQAGLQVQLESGADFEQFFGQAPQLNPARSLITGLICGVRVEAIDDPTMKAIRQLDKLVDELSKGRAMSKVLRS
jgi:hypothetical protein